MERTLENLSMGLRENASVSNRELVLIEKAVFAERLVNSLTLLYQRQPFTANIHPSYREKVTDDHFSPGIHRTVTSMMAIIDPEIDTIFEILKQANCLNRREYMRYAKEISMKYAEEDFEPLKFLYFCVHVTKLAISFYSEGVREAHCFAFQAVLRGLQACDIDEIGWNSFKSRAEHYSPSAEAIANRSCVTAVCDDVPTIDSVEGLRVTSDEATSSSEGRTSASSEDEEDVFSSLNNLCDLSPVGEAANTYFLPFENQALGQQSSSGLPAEYQLSDDSSGSEDESSNSSQSANNPHNN